MTVALVAVFIASPARAEIADKMPSTLSMWAWAFGLIAVAILFERVRHLLGLVVVPFAAFLLLGAYMQMADPLFGPAILAELGQKYIAHSYASALVGLVGPLAVVLFLHIRRRRREPS